MRAFSGSLFMRSFAVVFSLHCSARAFAARSFAVPSLCALSPGLSACTPSPMFSLCTLSPKSFPCTLSPRLFFRAVFCRGFSMRSSTGPSHCVLPLDPSPRAFFQCLVFPTFHRGLYSVRFFARAFFLRSFVRTFLCVLLQAFCMGFFTGAFSVRSSAGLYFRALFRTGQFPWALSLLAFSQGLPRALFSRSVFHAFLGKGYFWALLRGGFILALSRLNQFSAFFERPSVCTLSRGLFPCTTTIEIFQGRLCALICRGFLFFFPGFFAVFFHALFCGGFSLRSLV